MSFGGGQPVPPMPSYAGMQQGGAPNYGQAGAPMPGRQVTAFQSDYDHQPPQISLGASAQVNRQAQSFYESEQPDADFLGEAEIAAKETAKGPRISSLRNRSMVMVGAALLGAVALGGALAFAYKQSGGGIGAGQPPLVQADSRPVKAAPDQPGGKDFPHKNKLIYDRLQNGDQPEADQLVPRQEELAMPAMPGATAAIPAGADGAPQTTQSVDTPATVASTDDPAAAEDGGPRKVKTMKVTADGSVVEAEAPAEVASADAPAAAEAQPQLAATAPAMPAAPAPAAAPAAAEPAEVAAVPPTPAPAAKPKPAPKPAPVAAAEPAPQAAPAKPASYVVQLGSKKDQTEALASFADMQQKYPSLLANYRPMVQKADLGSKGTWYRLRVGPIADKGTASKLCSQLKAQGQADCMVATQ